MKISLETKDLSNKNNVVSVYFAYQSGTEEKPAIQIRSGSKNLDTFAKSLVEKGVFKGELGTSALDHHSDDGSACLIVGLGNKKDLKGDAYRVAGAHTYTAVNNSGYKKAAIELSSIGLTAKQVAEFQAFVEGYDLANYDPGHCKTKKDKDTRDVRFVYPKAPAGVKKAFDNALIISDSVKFARYLGDMPGNLMNPTILGQETQKKAKGTKLKVTVWDKKRIEKERMGGLIGVSNGSAQPPRFIVMEYNGAGASKKHMALVGKGLTFDCGGISIKPSPGMEEMKFDMCGGANVIGAMIAIARLGLKVNIKGYVPSTENLAGAAATKPGDIHTFRSGKTAEINNTDAEGRLILADALDYASEQKPYLICDAATLTGAMMIALGNTYTGYFTKEDKTSSTVEKAAKASNENVWRMPLHKDHMNDIKGTYADLSNIGNSRHAGSSTAAAFLNEHVGKDIPWAHFDIAGTGWHTGHRLAYNPKKGASGAMVRTFVEIARIAK
jgi:leucyl aminopeptidase